MVNTVLDWRSVSRFLPDNITGDDCEYCLPFQRPAVEGAVLRFAGGLVTAKNPGAISIDDGHVSVRADAQSPFGQSEDAGGSSCKFCNERRQWEPACMIELH